MRGALVNTVLGPVPADELGFVAVHESLLSVFPGAQYGYDIVIDRAEVFARIADKLGRFASAGGGTIVDSTGMFAGRDLPLYETLSRATGVHIVASSGQGAEAMLGGYFLTPQTDPPTPWPADRFAQLYGDEVREGMVVPRVERRAAAGLIATATTRGGLTPTDESQLRGCARAASAAGAPLSIAAGADAPRELGIALEEGLVADRIVIGGMDRADAAAAGWPATIASAGAYVAIDHVGSTDAEHLADGERARLVADLIEQGLIERILLSTGATGAAYGEPGNDLPYETVLTTFVPLLRERGLDDAAVHRILIDNPAALLAVR